MSRVLVIDHDPGTLFSYKSVLRTGGHDVSTAALGEDGLWTARRDAFDVVLCDLHLPDVPGLEIVRRLRECSPLASIVVITDWSTPESVAGAKRLGVTSYASKPLIGDDLLMLVSEALRRHASAGEGSPPVRIGYAARRWAGLVVRATHLFNDPKTVTAWCREVGIARGTLKVWCRSAGATPKSSLDLLRLLRVVCEHSGEPWDVGRRLDIIDARTARALMARAGFSADHLVPSVDSFLRQQRLITSSELVGSLRERLLHLHYQ